MAGIKDYSTTQADNTTLNGINVAEGMLPSQINNALRALMANTREWYNDSQWVIYGDGDAAHTFAYVSGTSFTIAGANVTPIYEAGRRVKIVASTPGTIYGTISSSSFSTNTTVNVTWDSGTLSDESLVVYLGVISKSNNSIPTDVIDSANIKSNAITSAKIANGTIVAEDLASDSISTIKILDSNITTAKIADNAVTVSKIADAAIITNAEASGHTPDDNTFYTTSAADTRFYNADSGETINSGDSWSASDSYIATTAAIDARITDLVDSVGGFFPIDNEDSFPITNPNINDGTGTIVSIGDAGGMVYNRHWNFY